MNKYSIILMAVISITSLQASEEFFNSLQSSACPSPYLQPGGGVSQLTSDLLAAEQAAEQARLSACRFISIDRNNYMVQAGRHLSRQYQNKEISEEVLVQVLRDSQESPTPGVSASLFYGFYRDQRMDSPSYKKLKEIYDSPSSSPEVREVCKRKMNLILNN